MFGRVPGLVAALALAVSPVSVSVNRDNNPDALLALLLIASAYVGVRAVESGRLRTLLLSAVLVGLAFNTKMLAAMVVVPGMALAYVLFVRLSWRRRLAYLAVAGVVLVAVSGAWIAAVDLTPASQRPYVGSTSDNSELSLAFDYNGLGRVDGQTGGTSFGGGLGGAFSGTPGWLRLINDALGDQGGWLLPLAILGGISALVAAIRLRRRRELAALTRDRRLVRRRGGRVQLLERDHPHLLRLGARPGDLRRSSGSARCRCGGMRGAIRSGSACRCSHSRSPPGSRSTSCVGPTICPGSSRS